MRAAKPQLPDKLYFKIGEVSRITGVKPHVLRYWESQGKIIRPNRRRSRPFQMALRTTRQITASGGQIVKVAPWGRRRLAYPIERYREGSYHIVVFEAPSDTVAEVRRTLSSMFSSIMRG